MHLQPDVFLSRLIMEYNSHKDIAIIKYGLKVIAQCRYNAKNWPAMQSRLINLWVRFPSLSDHVIPILWHNKDKVNKSILKKALYSIINESLLLNREQELIWATWYAKVFDIPLAQPYIISILKSSNDAAIIILLDYIYKKGLQSKSAIKQQISFLHDSLVQEDVDDDGKSNQLMWTSHWLLAYEADRNKWLNVNGKVFNYAQKNQFFKELLAKGVAFYDPSFIYDEPAKKTRNYEYATRSELYSAINKLKKMIDQRLKEEGEQDCLTMTPEEAEIYEEFVHAWEQEETVYIG